MNYTLSPKDMSSTQLSNDLIQLIEEMARNVYEVWAVTHIAQGWTWGAERNASSNKYPCLIPYDQLREDERKFDCNTTIETLKLIQSLEYRIERVK